MKNQQGIIWAPVLIIVATIVVAGVAGYFLFQAGNTNQTENDNVNVLVVNQASSNTNRTTNTSQVVNSNVGLNTNTTSNTNTVSNTNTATDPTAGWKTYSNSTYNFSFKYPPALSVKESTATTGSYAHLYLTFTENGTAKDYWLEVGTTSSSNNSLTAFEQTYGFGDLSNVVGAQNTASFGPEKALHYCGIPGNIGYCTAFVIKQGALYAFDYREPATLPSDILSTFTFNN